MVTYSSRRRFIEESLAFDQPPGHVGELSEHPSLADYRVHSRDQRVDGVAHDALDPGGSLC